jgi:hypothetical protein
MAANDPGWEKWNKAEPQRLARYISPEYIAEQFHSVAGRPRTVRQLNGGTRFELVADVYAHLRAFGLRYDTTRIDFADYRSGEQVVRSAQQVREDGGSCLDLSLVFAGLCEYAGLRPILIVLRTHTLVAVALQSDFAEAKLRNGIVDNEWQILRQGLMAPEPGAGAHLLGRVNRANAGSGDFVIVECTGLSATGRPEGPAETLPFEKALAVGYEQLEGGDLRYLVDPTFFHLLPAKGFTPYPIRTIAGEEPARSGAVLGPAGAARLTEMLEFVDVPRPDEWTAAALRTLVPHVADLPTPAQPLVFEAVRDLTDTLVTADFIRDRMPQVQTTAAMRRALRLPGSPPAPAGRLESLADYLEHIALNHHGGRVGLHRWLASFVARLALDHGLDPGADPVRRWARELDIEVVVNDAAGRIRAEGENARARLVVSLHASVAGDWPEQVVAWWLLDDTPSERRIEKCVASQRGLEAAIGEHLDWAEEQARAHRLKLERIDVAVPTGLLPRWRPEETVAAQDPLVHQYQVVTRWSGRMGRNIRVARRKLDDIVAVCDEPVQWLDRQATAEPGKAVELVRKTVPAKAVGLKFHPRRHEATLQALLEQTPVLLWPDRDVDTDEVMLAELYGCWPEVPGTLNDAYLHRHDPARARPMAGLRAVWDDEDWLRFCQPPAGARSGRGSRTMQGRGSA